MAIGDKVKELSLNYGAEVVNLCISAYTTFGIFESKECKAGHKGTEQKVVAVVGTIFMAFMIVKNFFLTKSMETAIARSKAEAIAQANAEATAQNAEVEDRANKAIAQAKAEAAAQNAEVEDRANKAIAQAKAEAAAQNAEVEDRANKAMAAAEDRANKAIAAAEDRANKGIAQGKAEAKAEVKAELIAEIGYGGAYSAADFHDIDRAAAVDDPLFDDLESQKDAMKKS